MPGDHTAGAAAHYASEVATHGAEGEGLHWRVRGRNTRGRGRRTALADRGHHQDRAGRHNRSSRAPYLARCPASASDPSVCAGAGNEADI